MRHFRWCLATAALVAGVTTVATAQPLYDWTEGPPADSPTAVASAIADGPGAVSPAPVEHPVRVDLDLLRSGPALLGFPLPDGETIWALRTRFEDTGADGSVVWSGRDPGSAYNSVLLMLREDRLMGNFASGEDEYRILGSPKAGATISPVVRGTVAPDAFCRTVAPPAPSGEPNLTVAPPAPSGEPKPTPPEVAATLGSASSTTVTQDVLVLYTEEARQYVEEWSQDRWGRWLRPVYEGYKVRDLVLYANQVTNEVYSNSKIPAKAKVAGVLKMPADVDPGVGYTYGNRTLNWQSENVGLKKLRAEYKADIVYAYIYDTGLPCGEAFTPTKTMMKGHQFAQYAHAYTNLHCDAPGWYKSNGKAWQIPYYETMAHELGHIHGAFHDAKSSTLTADDAVFPYAFGYIDLVSKKKTVMANHNSAAHVNYYSNVRISPSGWTLGMANQAENERVVQAMAPSTSRLNEYPEAPSDLTVESTRVGTATLRWTDTAHNETGFRAYYRRLGNSREWKEWRFNMGWPNLEATDIPGLKRGKQYRFLVRAFNGSYWSTMSNMVTVRIK